MEEQGGKKGLWVWLAFSLVLATGLGMLLARPEPIERVLPVSRTAFLPGATTDGHYQIEIECETCHRGAFADVDSLQNACVECHGAELKRVVDSHPRTKFTDPRNADRVAVLDARYCVTCHQEHRPEITSTMGLSLPRDYCYRCHENVADERPTHRDLPFDSCASAGCHNFHDNQALYEDYLVTHAEAPPHLVSASVLPRAERAGVRRGADAPALSAASHDAPASVAELSRHVDDWAGTAHALAGVNCSDCHAPEGAWRDSPEAADCASCHRMEHGGFLEARHGMRIAAELSPMRPADARLPMREDASEVMDCNACHPAHAFDTRRAAFEACVGCHADEHTLAFEGSPHHALLVAEHAGEAEPGTGVSCATCHMPRVKSESGRVLVHHNPNDFLRPNEKAIRPVCQSCHGLGFALDALADPLLVGNNFRGLPSETVASIHYATELRFELEGEATRPSPNERGEEP